MILAVALTSGILSHTDVNVVIVPDRTSPLAHVRAAVYSGSAEDPRGKEGVAWATARVILDRAGSLRPLDGMTASVERDVTIFSLAIEGRKLDSALDALATILIEPIEPRIEIGAILDAREADGTGAADVAFDAILFMGHPYASPPEGTPRSRAGITGQDLADFHAGHYRKGNLAVGVAGAVNDGVPERIRAAFEPLGDGEPARVRRQPSYPTVPRVFVIANPGSARTILRIGQPLSATRGHPDHAAILLAAGCLEEAAGPAAIRIGSDRIGRRTGAFQMTLEVDPAEAGQAVRDAVGSLVAAAVKGFSEDCLAEAASTLEESVRDVLPDRALEMRLSEFLHGDGGRAERFAAVVSEPSPETVRSAFSAHLSPGRLSIVAIVPDSEAFVEQLRSTQIEGWHPLRASDFEITSLERTLDQGCF